MDKSCVRSLTIVGVAKLVLTSFCPSCRAIADVLNAQNAWADTESTMSARNAPL